MNDKDDRLTSTAGRVLTQEEALLRATEEQAGVVLDVYEDEKWKDSAADLDAAFVEQRLRSLTELRRALRSELDNQELLPKEKDPEVRQWQFFVDRMRGMLEDEPLAVPLEEEKRLLHLCNELLRANGSTDSEIRKYRDELISATRRLRDGD